LSVCSTRRCYKKRKINLSMVFVGQDVASGK